MIPPITSLMFSTKMTSDYQLQLRGTRSRWRGVAWGSCCLLLFLLGCSKSKVSPPESKNGKGEEEGVSWKLDIEGIKNAYRDCQSYTDSGRVVLQYTLNGQPIEESHPFQTHLDRWGGGLLHWFKMRTHSLGEISVGRIVDLQTQNFGGQVQCSSQSIVDFVDRLRQDKIALHYLSGSDDIPWGKDQSKSVVTVLGIAHQLFFEKDQHWLQEKNLVESKAVKVNEQTYVDAVFRSSWGNISCRIDPERKLLLGFRLPSKLLDEKISSSPSVKGISFSMLFEDASFDGKVAAAKSAGCKLAVGEKAVNHFVRLPEAFPSPAIGKAIGEWNLVDRSGQVFDRQTTLGATNIFLFGDPMILSSQETAAIESLAKNNVHTNLAWIVPQNIALNSVQLPFSRMGLFSDQASDVLRFFQPSQSTFLFASDAKGTVQYVAVYAEDWLDEIAGVLIRIGKGDDVAREMHADYARYFAEYQQRLSQNAIEAELLVTLRE
jgi:hypothetical protein